MTADDKNSLKRRIAGCLAKAPEVTKIVVFGSFLSNESPNDMDVAVFIDTDDEYLPLALKYRQMARLVSESIPLDIVPVRPGASGAMLDEITQGEIVYERWVEQPSSETAKPNFANKCVSSQLLNERE